jgi:tetratricopeptide (TPR) repeat protein
MNYTFSKLLPLLVFQGSFWGLSAQDAARPLKTIDEVINGIDSLLDDIDRTSVNQPPPEQSTPSNSFLPRTFNPNSSGDQRGGSFRLQNELMPQNLRIGEPGAGPSSASPAANLDDINPMGIQGNQVRSEAPKPMQYPSDLNLDFKSASLEDLLREVELLELPEFATPLNIPEAAAVAQPMPVVPSGTSIQKPVEELATTQIVATPLLDPVPVSSEPIDIEEYTVLGEQIDQELKEKIREAIMETRLASSGSSNPYVTRSVFKATAYCNRVLGRLNAPYHKRYRRDVLLSLITMHERNQAWVDAAKSYERFLEEFAADERYPFEDHEDAPGIPDLRAGLGSVEKLLEGQKRGAPTIPETHIRAGKIYRSLGAHRMALNKFYDAINATLTIPNNKAFDLAERSKGKALEHRLDAESNQAMFEIAETFMDSEDYANAIKFYDRLWRLEQLEDTDRAVVRFNQGLAHYRRARETLRKQERIERLPQNQQVSLELDYDQTPRADFAKVKEILRGYGTLYPQSQYVPESHYLLALTFEQLNQDEESIKELLVLLREAYFNPELILNLESTRAEGDRDYATINELKGIWNFWKKKTGNYLANKFFENAEYFNAYRIYSALQDIDPSPSWQVPVLYQIALCEEKLGNYVQAMETYSSIEEYVNSVKEAREDLANSEYLNFVFGMAKWRREQLEDTRAIRQAVNRYGIYTIPGRSDPALSAFE